MWWAFEGLKMVKTGFGLDIVMWNSLLNVFCKAGRIGIFWSCRRQREGMEFGTLSVIIY